ncbi:hypothetical protein CAPTEDRAFT_198706 [Capitella teleta]|uniref:Uncharacterized protein n=1 Tax=Capitella teleta TaxID=283909 RepID=R7VB20_CAPTE|nr:hypothetical protein CAPTEDRAFT_198706 [Capitella teleta]|eukprot:ELU12905.1 hypothetical protein CAPTEDRAFT_198706 [Capitella teleta]
MDALRKILSVCTMQFLRSLATKVWNKLVPRTHDTARKWARCPENWPEGVVFCNPNNHDSGKKKPKKPELIEMIIELLKRLNRQQYEEVVQTMKSTTKQSYKDNRTCNKLMQLRLDEITGGDEFDSYLQPQILPTEQEHSEERQETLLESRNDFPQESSGDPKLMLSDINHTLQGVSEDSGIISTEGGIQNGTMNTVVPCMEMNQPGLPDHHAVNQKALPGYYMGGELSFEVRNDFPQESSGDPKLMLSDINHTLQEVSEDSGIISTEGGIQNGTMNTVVPCMEMNQPGLPDNHVVNQKALPSYYMDRQLSFEERNDFPQESSGDPKLMLSDINHTLQEVSEDSGIISTEGGIQNGTMNTVVPCMEMNQPGLPEYHAGYTQEALPDYSMGGQLYFDGGNDIVQQRNYNPPDAMITDASSMEFSLDSSFLSFLELDEQEYGGSFRLSVCECSL